MFGFCGLREKKKDYPDKGAVITYLGITSNVFFSESHINVRSFKCKGTNDLSIWIRSQGTTFYQATLYP
jgi:hypothetical protein